LTGLPIAGSLQVPTNSDITIPAGRWISVVKDHSHKKRQAPGGINIILAKDAIIIITKAL
jgi:hypothetical protein